MKDKLMGNAARTFENIDSPENTGDENQMDNPAELEGETLKNQLLEQISSAQKSAEGSEEKRVNNSEKPDSVESGTGDTEQQEKPPQAADVELPERPTDSEEPETVDENQAEQLGDISVLIEAGDPVIPDGVQAELDNPESWFIDSVLAEEEEEGDLYLIKKNPAGEVEENRIINWEDVTPRYDSLEEYLTALSVLCERYIKEKDAGNQLYQKHLAKLIQQVRHFALIFRNEKAKSHDVDNEETLKKLDIVLDEARGILAYEGLLTDKEMPLLVDAEELASLIKEGDPVPYTEGGDDELLDGEIWRLARIEDGQPVIYEEDAEGNTGRQKTITWQEIIPTGHDPATYQSLLVNIQNKYKEATEAEAVGKQKDLLKILKQMRFFATKYLS